MKVAVIGAGKLGLPMSVVYASKGHDVTCLDTNKPLIKQLQDGQCPYMESSLTEYMQKYPVKFTSSYFEIVDSELVFVIVPTPSLPNGMFSNAVVEMVLSGLTSINYQGTTVVTSTVMPGSMRQFKETYGLKLLYNPEFVAVGSVIKNMLKPDNILIGFDKEDEADILVEFQQTIAGSEVPVFCMSYDNAELAKLSLNCYVTMKIAFANQIARASETIENGDVDKITQFLGSDSRIGKKYLSGGLGYGGCCFPRDNQAMLSMFNNPISQAVVNSNKQHAAHVYSLVQDIVKSGSTISVLGLTYKTETNIVEESQALQIAKKLAQFYKVRVFDPMGMKEAQKTLNNSVHYASNIFECLEDSELAVILTPWSDFVKIDLSGMKTRNVLDCWRILTNKEDCQIYRAVGLAK